MINFTYKHITQNERLEIYTSEGIKKLTEHIGTACNVQISFYRKFDDKNRLNEMVEMSADINENSYHIIGKGKNFKKSVNDILAKFDRQLRNSANLTTPLQQSA